MTKVVGAALVSAALGYAVYNFGGHPWHVLGGAVFGAWAAWEAGDWWGI